MNWRLMKPDKVPKGFISRCRKTKICPPGKEAMIDTFPPMQTPGLLDPSEFADEHDIEHMLVVDPHVEFKDDITLDSLKYAKQMGEEAPDFDAFGEKKESGKTEEQELAEYQHLAFQAVQNNNIERAEEYLDYGVIPQEARDEHGNTLLHKAVQQGNKKMTKFLLRRGAPMNVQNNRGNSILHYAFYYNFTALAEYLISKGADDTLANEDGLTCY